MTNELTRVIMQNIIEKCDESKKKRTSNMHVNDREINMIKSIIDKKSGSDIKARDNKKMKNKWGPKYITLDDLINKNR